MNIEKSRLLGAIRDMANRRIDEGANPSEIDIRGLVDEYILGRPQSELERVKMRYLVDRKTLDRFRNNNKISRHIQRRYGEAFRALTRTLAACEIVNEELTASFKDGLLGPALDDGFEKLGAFGGPLNMVCILIGMHARMIRIAEEIFILLRSGHSEGASARLRTLYELTIKTVVILRFDASPNRWELAERYYASGIMEASRQRTRAEVDPESKEIIALAQQKWGKELFGGDNNWALPGFPGSRKARHINFRDLEELVAGDRFRNYYIAGSKSIHAGALPVIEAMDLKSRYLFSSRARVDVKATGQIGHMCVFLLDNITLDVVVAVSSFTECWDMPLMTGEFFEQADLANILFHRRYSA